MVTVVVVAIAMTMDSEEGSTGAADALVPRPDKSQCFHLSILCVTLRLQDVRIKTAEAAMDRRHYGAMADRLHTQALSGTFDSTLLDIYPR